MPDTLDELLDVDAARRIDAKGAARQEIDPAQAELAVGVGVLAATYLGGVRWSALATVGRVDAREEGTLATADALFLHAPGPFCGSFF
jgi:predicted acetyltransferase